jgi:hypothetical protein
MEKETIEIMSLRYNRPQFPYDFKVDRTTSLGNPFYMKSEDQRDFVCDAFEKWSKDCLLKGIETSNYFNELLRVYKKHGKLRLFCWCVPKRCHAETIRDMILEKIKEI